MKKEIVALIPVKGSSERVKSKNIRPFHDTSLYELKLDQLKKVKGFTNVVVSSEDERMLEIAKENGFETHVRDSKYCTSSVPMSDVYSHIASEIEGENIAWVNVTNPLAGPEVYEKAIEEYNNMPGEYDCLLSVYEVKDYLFHEGKPVNFKPNPWPKSQDLSGVLAMSFIVNILKREDMVKWGSCVGNNPYFFCVDSVTSTDVDFQEDFDFCEMVYKQRLSEVNERTA
jgi:N-acylneuraminate cytidylyltransferase